MYMCVYIYYYDKINIILKPYSHIFKIQRLI